MMSNKLSNLDIESEFDLAFDEHQKDRNIERRNWEHYSGFDYGQWPEDAKRELTKANRHIIQLNFIRGKVNSLAGSIAKNGLEIDFVPVSDDTTEVAKVLKGLFYSDREMFDWDSEFLEVVKDGLIHRGVEEMYITEKYSPLGNVGFRRLQPGHVILDPNWVTHDSNDLTRLWKVAYLTPKEIKEIYSKSSDKVDAMIEMKAEMMSSYDQDSTTDSMNRFNLDQLYGDKYRVVEYHHIRTKKVKTILYVGENTTEDLTGLSDEQVQEYKTAAEEINPGKIIKKDKVEKEYWVTTTCNQLFDGHTNLEDSKSEIQIGRLPFFPWSAARINGRDSGVVTMFIDAQQAINKRESLSDHMISTSAHGAMFVDSALFDGDVAKTEAALKDLDKANARIVTQPGAIASGRNMFYQVPKTQYQGEIYQEIDRMRGHLDTISQSTATLEGRSESSHDTGTLFARRQMQSEIALTTLSAGLEQHWNAKGEAYMLLAKDLYSGAYRKFKTDFGIEGDPKQDLELNTGQVSLEDMPRYKVLVSQSPRGVTMREVEREVNSEVLMRIPQNQPVYQATILKNIMNTLDMTGKEKQELDMANEVSYQLAFKRAQVEMAGLDAQLAQLSAQQQQMQQQQIMQEQGLMQPGAEQQQQEPQQQQPQQ